MGCDYYIDKNLYILDKDEEIISFINLEKSRGYYWYNEDEDSLDYDFNKYRQNILEPSMNPIILYINNTFCKSSFEIKYKELINNELILYNKSWENINKIIKKEERYER